MARCWNVLIARVEESNGTRGEGISVSGLGLKLKPGLKNKERREVAQYYLKLVGLEKFTHANIHELSGGMKQRVALARALAPNPRVLLMDEPFAALDAMTREQLYGDIQRIWQARKKTIVFVTHDVGEAVFLADRVLVMSERPGAIAAIYDVPLARPRSFAVMADPIFLDLSQRIRSHFNAQGSGE